MNAKDLDELNEDHQHTKRLLNIIMHNHHGQTNARKGELTMQDAKIDGAQAQIDGLKKVMEAHTELLQQQGGGWNSAACMISPATARLRPRLVAP